MLSLDIRKLIIFWTNHCLTISSVNKLYLIQPVVFDIDADILAEIKLA